MKRTLLAFNGSTGTQSANTILLREVHKLLPAGWTLDIFPKLDELPFFNPGISEDELPAAVKEMLARIEKADAILICTPEYVFSLPAVLKNALEWTVATTVFSYKSTGFIVAAASGAKAFEALDLILATLIQTSIPEKRKLLIQGAKGKISAEEGFKDQQLKAQVSSLIRDLLSAE
jgi:chromate reductase